MIVKQQQQGWRMKRYHFAADAVAAAADDDVGPFAEQ